MKFSDFLSKPVQRIMKYEQLMQEILKHSEQANLNDEAETLRQAIRVVENVIEPINDTIAVERSKEFQVNVILCIAPKKNIMR